MAVRRGYHRVSIALDETNATFARNFLDAFRSKFVAEGGEIAVEIWHDFRSVVGFRDMIARLTEPKPDVVFFIANAVDVARLAQQFRNIDRATRIVAVEWAGTQQLIELGGRAVNGIEVLQLFDRFGKEERFANFVEAYKRRFDSPPSFSSIIAYEVVLVLARAAEKRKDGQGLKQAILANGPYEGLQQKLTIDPFGDSRRAAHFVIVAGTEFRPAP
jgi:branched-chain amino acid transport system substrate-binding protein